MVRINHITKKGYDYENTMNSMLKESQETTSPRVNDDDAETLNNSSKRKSKWTAKKVTSFD